MKKLELKQIIKEEIQKVLNKQKQKCYAVLDTSGRIYGVFLNKELAEQEASDAERNLGFEGSSARVYIKETTLYM
jgi:hypothetical protein